MTPRPARVPSPRRDRQISAELAALSDRLEKTERHHRQLQNTVAELAREIGLSMGCLCDRCDESYTFIRNGTMYCPRCGHRQSL
ncbi:hypothetical protein [Natrinema sp. SYSU A 869]|uniref:hypothetical protein n=1 Tax=Natrinema sp. SYSU A 869 TaxID=2871694 RepID=UPI001CA448C3|nr:hypothetical protein [Natrinema sp. SYSU A 869]